MIEWQHRKPALPAEERLLPPPGVLPPERPGKGEHHLQGQAAEKPQEVQAGAEAEADVPPAEVQPGRGILSPR